jgi:hypothetical protein
MIETLHNYLRSLGYNTSEEGTESSTYIRVWRNDPGMYYLIRISDHDPITARSRCADMSYTWHDLVGDDDRVRIGVDEDGMVYGDDAEDISPSFPSRDERDQYLARMIVEDCRRTTQWIRMDKF